MPSLKRKGNNTDDVHVSAKRARRPIIHDLAHQIKSAQKKKAVFNGAETIISKATLVYPWLTRDMVYGYLRRMKAKEAKYIKMAIEKNTNTNSNSLAICNNHGGRPEGSTTKQIDYTKTQKEKAIDDISILYAAEKKANNGSLKRGSYKKIHNLVISKLGIKDKDFKVNIRTVQTRITRNSLVVNSSQNKMSPVHEIEPVILQVCLWKQEAGQPITPTEGLALANSLIDQKPIQDKLKVFQASIKKTPTGLLSTKYWQQFMRRHIKKLQAAKGHLVASNRTEWVTYQNIECMYALVYEQMINSGVARRLPESEHYWTNENGERVESENDAVGMKIEVEITYPEWILFGDEVGTDISQKDDGHVGGQKFVVQKGTRANIKSSHKDGRFTAIGLTAASGDPVTT